MWGKLIVGLIALIAADKAVQVTTGKHVHEHLFVWWRRMSDTIAVWLRTNKGPLGINKYALVVLDKADSLVCAGKNVIGRVRLRAEGIDARGNRHRIAEESELSMEEVFQQRPELRAVGTYEYTA